MKSNSLTIVTLVILAALPVLLISGCITKEYVDQQDNILQGMIEDNSSNVAAANKRIDSLKSQADGNSSAIAALQEGMAGLEGLGSRVDDLETSVTDLKNQKIVRRVILEEQVLFEFNKWMLTDKAKALLDSLALDVSRAGYDWVVVSGHADSIGSTKYNRALGLHRAQSVAAYLGGSAGLDRQKIIVTSYGEEIPVFANDTQEGRAKNRRVEILVYRSFLSARGEMTSLATEPAR